MSLRVYISSWYVVVVIIVVRGYNVLEKLRKRKIERNASSARDSVKNTLMA